MKCILMSMVLFVSLLSNTNSQTNDVAFNQAFGSSFSVRYSSNIPVDAVNLNPKKYRLGACSWASMSEIHICNCHKNKYGKLKIGALTKDLPKMTGQKQLFWKTEGNEIHIVFQKSDSKSQVKKKWVWNGTTFYLKRQ